MCKMSCYKFHALRTWGQTHPHPLHLIVIHALAKQDRLARLARSRDDPFLEARLVVQVEAAQVAHIVALAARAQVLDRLYPAGVVIPLDRVAAPCGRRHAACLGTWHWQWLQQTVTGEAAGGLPRHWQQRQAVAGEAAGGSEHRSLGSARRQVVVGGSGRRSLKAARREAAF